MEQLIDRYYSNTEEFENANDINENLLMSIPKLRLPALPLLLPIKSEKQKEEEEENNLVKIQFSEEYLQNVKINNESQENCVVDINSIQQSHNTANKLRDEQKSSNLIYSNQTQPSL